MNGLASITYPGKQTAFSRSVYTCTHVHTSYAYIANHFYLRMNRRVILWVIIIYYHNYKINVLEEIIIIDELLSLFIRRFVDCLRGIYDKT